MCSVFFIPTKDDPLSNNHIVHKSQLFSDEHTFCPICDYQVMGQFVHQSGMYGQISALSETMHRWHFDKTLQNYISLLPFKEIWALCQKLNHNGNFVSKQGRSPPSSILVHGDACHQACAGGIGSRSLVWMLRELANCTRGGDMVLK